MIVAGPGRLDEASAGGFTPRWLTTPEVLEMHEMQLQRFGGARGIVDPGALEAALARPLNKWAYGERDLATLAAAYGYGLCQNHPFVDGNKRVGFHALMVFLRLNGVRFAPPPAEATVMMLMIAAGEASEAALARWLHDRWPD